MRYQSKDISHLVNSIKKNKAMTQLKNADKLWGLGLCCWVSKSKLKKEGKAGVRVASKRTGNLKGRNCNNMKEHRK